MRTFIAILLTLFVSSALAAGARELKLQTAVAGIHAVEVDAEVGSIEVESAGDGMISASLKLEANEHGFWIIRWHDRKDVEAVQKAQLVQHIEGDTLHLVLETPVKPDGDSFKQTWQLQVPAALAAKLSVKVGRIKVDGIGGGVDLQANVGKIVADLPGGAVTAHTNVGNIDLKLATTPGKVTLRTNVGSLHMTAGGQAVEARHVNETGGSIDYSGGGTAAVDASVNVGKIQVEVPPGPGSIPAGDTLKKGDQAQPAPDPGNGSR